VPQTPSATLPTIDVPVTAAPVAAPQAAPAPANPVFRRVPTPVPVGSTPATGPAPRFAPLSDKLGAEVRGIDLSLPLDDATFKAIFDGWMKYQVLRFPAQDLTPAALVAFSSRFGPLDIAPPNENGVRAPDGHPEILVLSNIKVDGLEIGSLGNGEAVWHTDMSYIPAPPMASCLYALEIPPVGGDTGFSNMYMALETLPKDLYRAIEGRTIKHDATRNSAGLLRAGQQDVTDVTTSPGFSHPVIRTHPVTGRQCLYLGRRRHAYVDGLPVDESEALLDALWAHATEDRFAWYQNWRTGDLIMWDNRCVMHRRDGFPADSRRLMHRTQIGGDQPV